MPSPLGSLRLVWLEAFVGVATGRSVTETAEMINSTQSGTSKYIDQLEGYFDTKLFFKRTKKGLTSEGKYLLPIAINVISMVRHSRKMFCALKTDDAAAFKDSFRIIADLQLRTGRIKEDIDSFIIEYEILEDNSRPH